ncbi:MAG: hypothetical protein R2878_02640 [Thermoleophilia bacterium]
MGRVPLDEAAKWLPGERVRLSLVVSAPPRANPEVVEATREGLEQVYAAIDLENQRKKPADRRYEQPQPLLPFKTMLGLGPEALGSRAWHIQVASRGISPAKAKDDWTAAIEARCPLGIQIKVYDEYSRDTSTHRAWVELVLLFGFENRPAGVPVEEIEARMRELGIGAKPLRLARQRLGLKTIWSSEKPPKASWIEPEAE